MIPPIHLAGAARRRVHRWRLRRRVADQVLDLLATPEGRSYLQGLRDHVKGADPATAPVMDGRYLQMLAAPYGDDGDHDQEMTR